jgi:hypothetical protein
MRLALKTKPSAWFTKIRCHFNHNQIVKDPRNDAPAVETSFRRQFDRGRIPRFTQPSLGTRPASNCPPHQQPPRTGETQNIQARRELVKGQKPLAAKISFQLRRFPKNLSPLRGQVTNYIGHPAACKPSKPQNSRALISPRFRDPIPLGRRRKPPRRNEIPAENDASTDATSDVSTRHRTAKNDTQNPMHGLIQTTR